MDFSFRAAEKGGLLWRTGRHVQGALTPGCPPRGGIVDGGGGQNWVRPAACIRLGTLDKWRWGLRCNYLA